MSVITVKPDLPVWDLTDLFADKAAVDSSIVATEKDLQAFADQYRGKVADLSGDALADAIARMERFEDVLGRIAAWAYLGYASNMTDPENARVFQDCQEKLTALSNITLFFTLEINKIEEDAFQALIAGSDKLAHFGSWLRDTRLYRDYQLSEDLETLLREKDVAGKAAWIRLFDETMAGLRVDVDGEDKGLEEALHMLSDNDRSNREKAAKALSVTFQDNIRLFAHITNTLAKDKAIEDKWRGCAKPETWRHLANQVEQPVVDALVDAVQQSYGNISHRYYAMKAKWLGLDVLQTWDRNAPLPDADEREIPWDEAAHTVLKAYGDFSPELANLGSKFFNNGWIDAGIRAGKAPGAFAHPVVPSAHPYLMLNYQGKSRDVMTLAHELGHGVHQLLAAEQGALMCDTPLTLAETASVFGEQLTFRAMLDKAESKEKRKIMLASKVEDMINTVVRQTAFFDFERRVHDARSNGEVPVEDLAAIWMTVQAESLGPVFDFDDGYQNFWCYIPHFIHSPFYVYAYAFGDCLVNALYAVYQEQPDGFEGKYFDMLKSGGTLLHKDLLAPFGLDATDPAFWRKGLGVIEGFIDELEDMA